MVSEGRGNIVRCLYFLVYSWAYVFHPMHLTEQHWFVVLYVSWVRLGLGLTCTFTSAPRDEMESVLYMASMFNSSIFFLIFFMITVLQRRMKRDSISGTLPRTTRTDVRCCFYLVELALNPQLSPLSRSESDTK